MFQLNVLHCKSFQWPPVSGGRWSFRPRIKCLIIKFDINLLMIGRLSLGRNGHRPPETVGHLSPMQRIGDGGILSNGFGKGLYVFTVTAV